ncbi:sensor domain-containing diguanylate cyclase [Pseudomonas chlororaphis]|uniref:sensor domain-containing diguanylate cyclase n=1 Tax=Pseudomonas chlororaphis TaxID=587753 RepID=UPI0006A5B1DD|nr:sensor domain-containing diguanylate cyclase [Pseudomonas chlororaphis]AZD00639.1 GGDEF domain protein [Pseudomonas chlororaphis subsp. chlororaphis]MBM0283463.1 GGDEF domain-containing protein [Pseudomonas chlororaphis]MDO1503789.1 sensor domain-containing diguanylate cyclase [Pseudomonas chlororaphis]ORM48850.1 GGDEF domain-containing protein [Pseudomonas chlororaphis subsp. chlororaphis]TWR95049.1 sensor domain-containing diguanylate cyclase [Pseudomonas chlororaphis subsp. chlororaphis]
MPLSSPLYSQRWLIITLIVLLGGGFMATSLLSYYASRTSIRDNIVNTELPLTSDTVYSEIQKDLVRPILISSMMSRDTFMRDWVIAGEHDPEQMTRYLNEVMTHYGAYTAFFVSNSSLTYYHAKGVLKKIAPDTPRDAWYFRVRDMATPYEINVDPDQANQNNLTFFINYKVYDYQDNFIGVAGVGLKVDTVVKLIDRYQQRYQRSVYFVDTQGRIVLTGAEGGPQGARAGQSLFELENLRDLQARMPKPHSGNYEYSAPDQRHFLNVRFIPELNWYLFVDKREDRALGDIRRSLYLNLLICLAITLIVLTLLNRVVRRFQHKIETQATLDSLTGLPNRRGFDLLAAQAMLEAQREPKPLAALLLDLDHFKRLNDTYGHLAGDQVLSGFARHLASCLRQSDIVCRWGGEEFIVLLKDTDSATALKIAEKIRLLIEQQHYAYEGKNMRLTVSIGVTTLQADDTLHSLLSRADHAMYRAKQTGRNRTCMEMPHSRYE